MSLTFVSRDALPRRRHRHVMLAKGTAIGQSNSVADATGLG
jgi:hypothetical protein